MFAHNKDTPQQSELPNVPGIVSSVLLLSFSFVSLFISFPIFSSFIKDDILIAQLSGLSMNIIFLVFCIWLRHRNSQSIYEWNNARIPAFYLILLTFGFFIGEVLLGFCTAAPLSHLLEAFSPSPITSSAETIKPNIIHFLLLALVAPCLEEIIYRGIVLQSFLTRYRKSIAIVCNIIIFTSLHGFGSQTPSQIVAAAALCSIFVATNSVALCILLHILHNSLLFMADIQDVKYALISKQLSYFKVLSFHNIEYWLYTFIGTMFLAGCFYLMIKKISYTNASEK